MKFKNVSIRVSTQVINYGLPERWHVAETLVELEGDDTFEMAAEAALEKVNAFHEKHSQSCVDSQIAPVVKKETFADLKKELHVTPK